MKHLSLGTALALGVLLLLPTVAMGFYADDFFHQTLLSGRDGWPDKTPFGLFDFGTFDEWSSVEGATGPFPWWTGEDWSARFLRPLSSLLLSGLHAAFGATAWPYHVAGLALHAGVIVLAHGLYLKLGLPRRAADLGALLLATFHGAVLPVGWAANHNSVLVALFSVLALRSLLVERLRGRNVAAALAFATLAALAKESGAGALVLVAALCAARLRGGVRREGRGAHRAGVAVASMLLAGHAAWFLSAGYGTNSVFYADPSTSPARFLGNELVLFTAGLAGLGGPLMLDALTMFPELRPALIAFGVLVAWPACIWIARTLGAAPATLTLGLWTAAFLALQAGVAPSGRLLYVPMVGAAGLLGAFFELQGRRRRAGTSARLTSLAARALFVSATLGSGLLLLLLSTGMVQIGRYLRASALAADVGPADLGPRDVLVLQAESQMQAFTTAFTYGFLAEDQDVTFWNLQVDARALTWARTGPSSFELESRAGPFLASAFERLYLTSAPDFRVGHRWRTSLFEVEALAVEGGLPTRLAFELERELKHPSLRFVRAELGVLTAIEPPVVGASITLPRPARTGPMMP